ncbi:MAG: NYN domain-containing protein [Gemmatimonadetes bacterium]|nr:NYN domain-containing protein [Gemmatimonadota bacterium]
MGKADALRGPTEGTRVVVYVDGFNLYFGLKSKGYSRYYWLDIHLMATRFLKEGQKLVGVSYFTADISGPPSKVRRQQTFLDALLTHTPVRITRGHYLVKERQCRRCGSVQRIPEEKKTDSAISAQMVADAFTDRFDTAFLVSGDSDLVPPIEVIREHLPEKRVIVAFPPGRSSKDLRQAAHGWFYINQKTLRVSQLPNVVTKPNGHELRRPSRWH